MVIMSALAARFAFRLSQFCSERRAVAAVEFAMLLPVLVSLYLGCVELSRGIAADRKVTLVAHTVADLATQFTDIADSDMSNILNASAAIMAPYAASSLQAVVSELAIDAKGNATVVWSDTLNGTARTPGQTVTIPSTLAVPNTYLILGETTYNYNPVFGYVITGTLTLTDKIYMQPRQSVCVTRKGAGC
jgi:Flp pilus assembly protein TadG